MLGAGDRTRSIPGIPDGIEMGEEERGRKQGGSQMGKNEHGEDSRLDPREPGRIPFKRKRKDLPFPGGPAFPQGTPGKRAGVHPILYTTPCQDIEKGKHGQEEPEPSVWRKYQNQASIGAYIEKHGELRKVSSQIIGEALEAKSGSAVFQNVPQGESAAYESQKKDCESLFEEEKDREMVPGYGCGECLGGTDSGEKFTDPGRKSRIYQV